MITLYSYRPAIWVVSALPNILSRALLPPLKATPPPQLKKITFNSNVKYHGNSAFQSTFICMYNFSFLKLLYCFSIFKTEVYSDLNVLNGRKFSKGWRNRVSRECFRSDWLISFFNLTFNSLNQRKKKRLIKLMKRLYLNILKIHESWIKWTAYEKYLFEIE